MCRDESNRGPRQEEGGPIEKDEVLKQMKRTRIVGMLLFPEVALLNGTVVSSARESATVKVPFAFEVGNQKLPAGTYGLEMLTQSRPEKGSLEVMVLRGRDVKSYASFVAALEKGDGRASSAMFLSRGERKILVAVRANGRVFKLPCPETQIDFPEGGARPVTVVAEQTLAIETQEQK